ncbi:MAG: DJ-1/PfpI family protein [Candidatus Aenigmatarchaeota archaeon]
MKKPRVLMPLSDGFDEIEAFVLSGMLKRAGVDVKPVGLQGVILTGSDGTKMVAEGKFEDIDTSTFDAILLIGGGSWDRLGNSSRLMDALHRFNRESKTIAAIGETPELLAKAGMLNDRKATIRPGMERKLSRPRGEVVVVDGHIMTAQSPASAMELGFRMIEKLLSKERVNFARDVLAGKEERI